jgi:hypothetical protein
MVLVMTTTMQRMTGGALPAKGLDPGIERIVRTLMDAGVETFESCEGGPGHAFTEPTVRFGAGRPEEGWQALAVCLTFGYPVLRLATYWNIEHGHVPTGPYWELVFSRLPD